MVILHVMFVSKPGSEMTPIIVQTLFLPHNKPREVGMSCGGYVPHTQHPPPSLPQSPSQPQKRQLYNVDSLTESKVNISISRTFKINYLPRTITMIAILLMIVNVN